MQYVGENALHQNYRVLPGYTNTITDLDPQFGYAYRFGGLLLPELGEHEAARTLLEKGEQNLPHDAQISYDLGFINFYYFEDYQSAISAYERCLTKKNFLPSAQTLLASLRAKNGKTEIAFSDLITRLQSANESEYDFLALKAQELGKLLALEYITSVNPPATDLSELIGITIPDTSKIKSLIPIIEQISGKKIISEERIILPELLQNPFQNNPYIWNTELNRVELKLWQDQRQRRK